MPRKISIKSKRPAAKSRKPVRRSRNQKYTSLMHGRRMRSKKAVKPYYDEFGFLHDGRGRIRGTYLDGFFYPD